LLINLFLIRPLAGAIGFRGRDGRRGFKQPGEGVSIHGGATFFAILRHNVPPWLKSLSKEKLSTAHVSAERERFFTTFIDFPKRVCYIEIALR
jgi:hypothetical protein